MGAAVFAEYPSIGFVRPRPSRAFRVWAFPSAAAGGATPLRRAARVLVVDDDPDILATLSATLTRILGIPVEVETVASGLEAKRRMEEGAQYDLVLTDERMPDMSGSELLLWLKTHRPATARVLMSAYYENYAARNLKEKAGAHTFIRKPFDVPAMAYALRRLLEGANSTPPGDS
jgi:CheY-like chemotaxis protein